jgi:hypothetical protein
MAVNCEVQPAVTSNDIISRPFPENSVDSGPLMIDGNYDRVNISSLINKEEILQVCLRTRKYVM